jgi:transporter family-2 protein
MEAVLLILAVSIGALLTAQAAANVQLNKAIGNPIGAAAVQLSIAGIVLIAITIMLGQLGVLTQLAGVPLWQLTGGLGSAIYIAAGMILFPRLGAVLSVGLFITGQMAASLALDGFGLLGLAQQTPSSLVVVGALAVAYGITVIVKATGTSGAATARWLWPLYAFGLLAGAALPVQAAINAQLRSRLDAPFAAAAVSFAVAVIAMLVVLVIRTFSARASRGRPRLATQIPWWGWLGGLIGAAYVTLTLVAVPELGAAPTIALTVAGQQLGSAAADHYSLLLLPRRPLTWARLGGVAVLVAGAALTELG